MVLMVSCTCRTSTRRLRHSHCVAHLVSRLLQLGTLRALQIAAVHSSPLIDVATVASSGVRHLAMACERSGWGAPAARMTAPRSCPPCTCFTWVRFCNFCTTGTALK